MSNWKVIRLELASTAEFPTGSVSRAYLLRVPLGDDDRVDEIAFLEDPSRALVRRHWSSEPDVQGRLFREGDVWLVRCATLPDEWLELEGRPLRPGRQVQMITAKGTILPFRIASIR